MNKAALIESSANEINIHPKVFHLPEEIVQIKTKMIGKRTKCGLIVLNPKRIPANSSFSDFIAANAPARNRATRITAFPLISGRRLWYQKSVNNKNKGSSHRLIFQRVRFKLKNAKPINAVSSVVIHTALARS